MYIYTNIYIGHLGEHGGAGASEEVGGGQQVGHYNHTTNLVHIWADVSSLDTFLMPLTPSNTPHHKKNFT